MNTKFLISGSFVVACLFSAPAAFAQVAADVCPPMGFLNTTNHVLNPSFEKADHSGGNHSAAAEWFVHGDNQGDPVSTSLIATTVPHGTDPGEGKRMIHVDAGGNESGVYQPL